MFTQCRNNALGFFAIIFPGNLRTSRICAKILQHPRKKSAKIICTRSRSKNPTCYCILCDFFCKIGGGDLHQCSYNSMCPKPFVLCGVNDRGFAQDPCATALLIQWLYLVPDRSTNCTQTRKKQNHQNTQTPSQIANTQNHQYKKTRAHHQNTSKTKNHHNVHKTLRQNPASPARISVKFSGFA